MANRKIKIDNDGSGITHFMTMIDESGSARPFRDQIVSGYNKMVQALRNNITSNIELKVSLALIGGYPFGKAAEFALDVPRSFHREIYRDKSIGSLLELMDEEYCPKGMSHLYDCLQEYLTGLESVPVNEAICLNLILAGCDSASTKATTRSITPLVEKLNASGNFTMTVLCDAGWRLDVLPKLGVHCGNISIADFGQPQCYDAMAKAVVRYLEGRSQGKLSTEDFYGGK